MAYLIFSDFKKQIQQDNLLQIIGNDLAVLNTAELQAIEEAFGYLTQKYDTAQEFSNTQQWAFNAIYQAADRVYLDAEPYSATKTYAINQTVLQTAGVFICIADITTPEAFNPDHWQLLGSQYDLFYCQYPVPLFQYQTLYKAGQQVFWKGKIYTCIIDSVQPVNSIQYVNYGSVPLANVFPDDPVNGATYWGTGTAYSIPANTLPTNTDYFTAGDNRTQSIVMIVVDIALFHLHSRIAPRNVPDLRRTRYANAIEMLEAFAKGKMTAKLPLIQPKSGSRIRFGGNIKNVNSY